jgi:hypothetical protein
MQFSCFLASKAIEKMVKRILGSPKSGKEFMIQRLTSSSMSWSYGDVTSSIPFGDRRPLKCSQQASSLSQAAKESEANSEAYLSGGCWTCSSLGCFAAAWLLVSAELVSSLSAE